jgi:hypothetical protein
LVIAQLKLIFAHLFVWIATSPPPARLQTGALNPLLL